MVVQRSCFTVGIRDIDFTLRMYKWPDMQVQMTFTWPSWWSDKKNTD